MNHAIVMASRRRAHGIFLAEKVVAGIVSLAEPNSVHQFKGPEGSFINGSLKKA